MLALARTFLERKGLGEARLESDLLVAFALGLDRLGLYMRLDQPIQGSEVDRARDLLVRRGRREPTAYIVGRREFYARDFLIGPGALVPRPETELLVDLAREWATSHTGAPRIVDVGAGSGCLAVTIALEIEGASVHGIDLSEEALDWARKNAAALEAPVEWRHGDGFEILDALVEESGPFDVIVSNPPYVETNERDALAPEVREHEPALALYAPPDDPDFWVRGLVERVTRCLTPGGVLLVELGHLQGERVLELARSADVGTADLCDDLAGIPRVLRVVR